jgi:hypothetical protein
MQVVKSQSLCMLMTGPGGRKTHVVKALKHLMTIYGCGHKIHFLAPTGGAAALIDGQTIHTGLGIKVYTNKAGKYDTCNQDLNVEIPL